MAERHKQQTGCKFGVETLTDLECSLVVFLFLLRYPISFHLYIDHRYYEMGQLPSVCIVDLCFVCQDEI
jgi:hypothetical protein